jgi:DNA modification methylase
MDHNAAQELSSFVPPVVGRIKNHQTGIPRLAKDPKALAEIDDAVRRVPTSHGLHLGDARNLSFIPDGSVHLVVTSPPYWTLKEYRRTKGQLGYVADYDEFLGELDKVWAHCLRVLVPGGRLIVVVGDVCLSRRKNNGRHTVVPLHASIQEHCRTLGFDNLAPIIWYKIANAVYEVERGGGFLGKPFEPNAVIKNDIEFILMQRKSGGYRTPSIPARVLSVISAENHQRWFQQIWQDVTGASTREHPAPYPPELAERLVRMFSFVGDTVLDPFLGTGTTTLAAMRWGRNSIGVEIDAHYLELTKARLDRETSDLFSTATISVVQPGGKRAASKQGRGSRQGVLAASGGEHPERKEHGRADRAGEGDTVRERVRREPRRHRKQA